MSTERLVDVWLFRKGSKAFRAASMPMDQVEKMEEVLDEAQKEGVNPTFTVNFNDEDKMEIEDVWACLSANKPHKN